MGYCACKYLCIARLSALIYHFWYSGTPPFPRRLIIKLRHTQRSWNPLLRLLVRIHLGMGVFSRYAALFLLCLSECVSCKIFWVCLLSLLRSEWFWVVRLWSYCFVSLVRCHKGWLGDWMRIFVRCNSNRRSLSRDAFENWFFYRFQPSTYLGVFAFIWIKYGAVTWSNLILGQLVFSRRTPGTL